MTIKGSLYVSIPIVKAFLSRKFLIPVKNWPKFSVFFGTNGVEIKIFVFETPKRHILERNDVIGRMDRKNLCRGLVGTLSEEPKKN